MKGVRFPMLCAKSCVLAVQMTGFNILSTMPGPIVHFHCQQWWHGITDRLNIIWHHER